MTVLFVTVENLTTKELDKWPVRFILVVLAEKNFSFFNLICFLKKRKKKARRRLNEKKGSNRKIKKKKT